MSMSMSFTLCQILKTTIIFLADFMDLETVCSRKTILCVRRFQKFFVKNL